MSKMTTTMRLTTVALMAGALILPGLALARDHDGDGHWDGGHERYYDGHRGRGRGHAYGHRGYDRDVVVVREPVYVRPRPTVVVREPVYVQPRATVVAPLWQPAGLGINLFLPLQHW
jgi:hypothetical protein